MADGTITAVVDLDDKKAQSELNRLATKIDNLKAKVQQDSAARMPLAQQAEDLGVQLDLAKAKLAEMQAASQGTYTSDQLATQKETVASLQSQWNEVQKRVEAYDRSIAKSNSEIEFATNRAGELSAQLAQVPEDFHEAQASGEQAGAGISASMEAASLRIEKLGHRILGLAKRVFIFSLITKALRGLRSWFSSVIQSNDEAAAAIARLKGALLTLAQPIMQVVIPVFISLVNVLTQVVTAIAKVVSFLFGTSLSASASAAKAYNDQQKAIKGVGGAAAKATKQLAAFDEINKLSAQDSGGGGGGSSDTGIEPDFSGLIGDTSPLLDKLMADVLAIGAGLLGWKIAKHFTDDLSKVAGIGMSIAGAFMLVYNWLDAWNNGIDWSNLLGMFAGIGLLAGGLALAFGKIAGGIGLIVGGLALLVVGIKDVIENGLNMQNTLAIIGGTAALIAGLALAINPTVAAVVALAAGIAGVVIALKEWITTGEITDEMLLILLAGIMAIGVGIALLTGSWIPLVVAGVAALATFIIARWDEVKEFFITVWEKIKEIWGQVAGWFMDKVIQPLYDKFKPYIDWLGKVFEGVWLVIQAVWKVVSGWFKSNVIDPLVMFFQTLWDIIKDDVIGMWEDIKTILRTVGDFVKQYVVDPVANMIKGLINALIGNFERGVNGIIAGVNTFLSLLNAAATWAGNIVGKDWSGVGYISPISIPRLAEGAVIPPNREFLAVLGDQSNGTNIETPLETMVEAFRQAMAEGGMTGTITIPINLDGREITRVVVRNMNQMQRSGAMA